MNRQPYNRYHSHTYHNDHQSDQRYATTKIFLRLIGIIMIVFGIILAFIGYNQQNVSMDSEGWFEQSSAGSFKIFIGLGLLGFGFMLLYISFIRRVSHYMATETQPAITTVGEGVGTGVARGINKGGGITLNMQSQNSPREVVKIKCRSCGYLDSEDATFCSNCGSKI